MKKIANILLAALVVASAILPASCGECKHNVGTWEVVTPATCKTQGEEKGVCGECLEMQTRAIPIDPDGHVYGEWAVEAPTETTEGKAVRTCTEDATHTVEATLPTLDSPKYVTQIVERPTAAKEGVRSYEYRHETGKITFTCAIPNDGIQSVLDAVGLGASAESRAYVRSANGTMNTDFLRPWGAKTASESYGANGYITGVLEGAQIAQTTDVSYAKEGYSNELTIAQGSAKGGFAVNGFTLRNTFAGSTEDSKKIVAVQFLIYNDEDIDHEYELFPQMTGSRTADGYTGVLKANEWTEIKISKAMWTEATKDPSNLYVSGNAAEVMIFNAAAGGTAETDHHFYIDAFSYVYLSQTPAQHSYVFGEDYTYILDGVKDEETGVISGGTDNCERWYFTDSEGELYGLTNYVDGRSQSTKITNDLLGSGNKGYAYGSRLFLQYANGLGTYFGVENLLEGLYRYARMSINNDFTQSTREVNGKTEYSFSFGYVNNSGSDSQYFAKTTVKFTLTPSYVIEYMEAKATIYANNFAQADAQGNPLPDVHTWDLDDDGYAYVIPGQENGDHYVSTIVFTQTEKQEGVDAPVNPHKAENLYVQDFKIFYKGLEVQADEAIPLAVTDGSAIRDKLFSIEEVKPEGVYERYDFDEFSFYLRTQDGEDIVDTPISYDTSKTITVDEQDGRFGLNSKLKGLQTVVVKTKNVERIILCNFSEKEPTKLIPKAYVYNKTTKTYSPWATVTSVSGHYVGQPFYFTAEVPDAEKSYVAGNYSITVKKDGVEVAESTLGNEQCDGKNAEKFTPNEAGTYVIQMKADLGAASCNITLNVVEAPAYTDLTDGAKSYAGELELSGMVENLQVEVAVSFADTQAVYDSDDKIVGYTSVATIVKYGDGEALATERLQCSYAVGSISGKWELTTTHLDGADLGYILALNEAYDFVLSHYCVIDSNFAEWEQVVLA